MKCVHFSYYHPGNVVTWIKSENEWIERVQRSDICGKTRAKDILMPWCMGMIEAKRMCNKFKGQITIITNSQQQGELFSTLKGIKSTEACLSGERVWTGFSDERVEGHFIDVKEGAYTAENFDPFPMPYSSQNGGRQQNCAAAWRSNPYESSWYDLSCKRKNVASFCRIDTNPRLQIRGKVKIYHKVNQIIKIKRSFHKVYQMMMKHYHLIFCTLYHFHI